MGSQPLLGWALSFFFLFYGCERVVAVPVEDVGRGSTLDQVEQERGSVRARVGCGLWSG